MLSIYFCFALLLGFRCPSFSCHPFLSKGSGSLGLKVCGDSCLHSWFKVIWILSRVVTCFVCLSVNYLLKHLTQIYQQALADMSVV